MSAQRSKQRSQSASKPAHKPKPSIASPLAATFADGYISRRQAAELLGVNTQTIDAQIKASKDPLPAYHFGRRVLIKRAELLVRVERRRV